MSDNNEGIDRKNWVSELAEITYLHRFTFDFQFFVYNFVFAKRVHRKRQTKRKYDFESRTRPQSINKSWLAHSEVK